MHSWITCFFLLVGTSLYGQISSLNGYFLWFEKCDVQTIKNEFDHSDYTFEGVKDSLGFHYLEYKVLVARGTPRPSFSFVLSDSAVTQLVIEHYDLSAHKNMLSHLKMNKFKTLNADVNGDYITTSYDNGTFILNQDYEVVDNAFGKGQIPHYRYRIVKKNGVFDALNGAKKKTETIDGKTFTVIENYKNGVLDGERITYFPGDSLVKKKENFRGGRLNGMVSDFDERGKLMHSSVHSYHWKYGMEKWYDGDGKVVKTLQWQRDVPVGTEKYTINGRTFSGATYKSGKKEGVMTIPVGVNWVEGFHRFALPVDLDWNQNSWIVTKIKALETVNFINNVKSGKAIGISPFSNDTLYVCYYKSGVIDSNYIGYESAAYERSGKNVPLTQTTFVNGLENGKRITWIRDGKYKDSIANEEYYVNGKLNGIATQFYSKSPNPEMDWFPHHVITTFVDGVQSGPYKYYKDPDNYQYGTFLNGQLHGKVETSVRNEKEWLKTIENYNQGIKTGEQTIEYPKEGILITENYLYNKKHGITSKKLNDKQVESRIYAFDYLKQVVYFNKDDFKRYEIVTNEIPDKICFQYEESVGGRSEMYTYVANVSDFPKTDTTLILLKNAIGNETAAAPKRNGKFLISAANYTKTGSYTDNKRTGYVVVEHKEAGVYEQITYENGSIVDYGYTLVSTSEAYTGTFISDVDGSSISVKYGVRHGWCTIIDNEKKIMYKAKYVKGVLKKQTV